MNFSKTLDIAKPRRRRGTTGPNSPPSPLWVEDDVVSPTAIRDEEVDFTSVRNGLHLIAMASNLIGMASNLLAMASMKLFPHLIFMSTVYIERLRIKFEESVVIFIVPAGQLVSFFNMVGIVVLGLCPAGTVRLLFSPMFPGCEMGRD